MKNKVEIKPNELLTQMNQNMRQLDEAFKQYENYYCDQEGAEKGCIEISLMPYYAFHGFNFHIQVLVYGEDWTKEWHEHFCKSFNVKLEKYVVKYKKDTGRHHEGRIAFIYMYKPLEFLGSDLLFDERIREIYTEQTVLECISNSPIFEED